MARLNEPPLAPSLSAAPDAAPPSETLEIGESSSTPKLSARELRTAMRTKARAAVPKISTAADADEVKRRFIRQNRELAKHNSTQSLRIRGLELDVNRLLQANQELRAEVIRVRIEVQDSRGEGLEEFRRGVGEKMRELQDFVAGWGGEERRRGNRKSEVLRGFEFRERVGLGEVLREGLMPVIEEGERWPRLSEGVVRLSGGSGGESPDLGPPPVVRFEVEEPIKFDARARAQAGEEEELPASLSVNLETRRKRKDGQPKVEIRRHSILPPPSPEGEVVAPTLRVGAKRKLADRDLDKPVQAPSKTDFTFHRRVPSNEQVKLGEGQAPVLLQPVEAAEAVVASPVKASRKVLGEKSANHSPRKAVPSAEKSGKDEDAKKQPAAPTPSSNAKKDRTTSRRSRLSSIPTAQPAPPPTVEIPLPEPPAEPSPPPTTTSPAAAPPTEAQPPSEPLFSPTPSTSLDTPPPTLAPGTRPSRRARAPVNYAEPSLVAKMRRPGKTLLDAIEGSADPGSRRVKNSAGSGKAGDRVVIKIEDGGEEGGGAWKERVSPWLERSQRRGRESGEVRVKVEPGLEETGVQALLPTAGNDELDAAASKLRELEVYDFKETDSSSPNSVPSPEQGRGSAGLRRHSSVPGKEEEGGKAGGGGRGSARAAGRRRSMLL